jgi:GH15 family glucan-1,4-alpha-glucosidase
MKYSPIGDYAIIGDCHTAALVGRDGSIDWYCPGRFDAPAALCRLLDCERGGVFRIGPPRGARATTTRGYRRATNILETTFQVDGASARLTDFMPVHTRAHHRRGYDVGTSQSVVRLVEGLGGEVELEVRFFPTFDFARAETTLEVVPRRGVVARSGTVSVALTCPDVELVAAEDGGVRGTLRLAAGEKRWLCLGPSLELGEYQKDLDGTARYWERWVAACTYQGEYRQEIVRSALTLKLLIYEPTGGVVAAPTTSLPEQIGGVRNWDYRYAWLRDSAMILYALLTLGYDEEADDFFSWLGGVCGSDPAVPPQIMFCIDGGRELPEVEMRHLMGYRDSRPVRVGNAAAKQQQLDIYGEVLSAAYLHLRHGHHQHAEAERNWSLLRALVGQAAQLWRQPDYGIWEVRGGPRHFLHSKLMCWVALDRGIRLAREDGLPAPLDRWRQVRSEIREAILTQGYNARLGAFTQAFGSDALDATALAIPRLGFLPATDPRVLSTLERVRQQLVGPEGFVHRYCTPDGLPGGEGTFTLCSLWLVDALALAGQVDEARALFERVLGCANDVGLFSEELESATGLLLGNFPQGFTHLGLVGAAVNLAKAGRDGPEHEPETEGERAGRARRAAQRG